MIGHAEAENAYGISLARLAANSHTLRTQDFRY
jgi:hypothetical protein